MFTHLQGGTALGSWLLGWRVTARPILGVLGLDVAL